jgi:hypothetical protein
MIKHAYLLLIILLFLLLSSCREPEKQAPRAVTRGRLAVIYRAIRDIENDRHERIDLQLEKTHGSNDLSGKLLKLLEREIQASNMTASNATKEFKLDGFGNPFNMELRKNLSSKKISTSLSSSNFELLVWSSGPNGINEFGFGDDVVYENEASNTGGVPATPKF